MAEVSAPVPELPPDGTGRPHAQRLRVAWTGPACDALLVSNLVNVRYLTGFSGSAGVLLVAGDDAVLITDGRYATQVQRELAASGAEARAVAVESGRAAELLAELAEDVVKLGLEAEHITWAKSGVVRDLGRRLELVATSRLVEGLRERKDGGEIARIAAAAAIADRALANCRGCWPVTRRRRKWPLLSTQKCAGWGPTSRRSRPSWPPGQWGGAPPPPDVAPGGGGRDGDGGLSGPEWTGTAPT